MKIKLLTANDILKLNNYINVAPKDKFYCNNIIKEIILKNAASVRNLIFEGNILCVAEIENSNILKLLILHNPKDSEEKNYTLNVHSAYFDKEFIIESYKALSQIYTFQKLKKLKLCLKKNEINSELEIEIKKTFKTEIELPMENGDYLEMSFYL